MTMYETLEDTHLGCVYLNDTHKTLSHSYYVLSDKICMDKLWAFNVEYNNYTNVQIE